MATLKTEGKEIILNCECGLEHIIEYDNESGLNLKTNAENLENDETNNNETDGKETDGKETDGKEKPKKRKLFGLPKTDKEFERFLDELGKE